MKNAHALLPILALLACLAPGCRRQGPAPAPWPGARRAGPDAQPLDEKTLALVRKLATREHARTISGDEVVSPPEFPALVNRGPRAVPTILHVLGTTKDPWLQDCLLEIAGRIGDPRNRTAIESFLTSQRPNAQSVAVQALGRLGCPASIPALRRLLEILDNGQDQTFTRLQILEALYQLGEEEVLAEVIRIGLASKKWDSFAADILSRHPPLRKALGFEGTYRKGSLSIPEPEPFLCAADEWYRLSVLEQPSPYAAPENPAFSEPFAAEKQEAWTTLLKRTRRKTPQVQPCRVLPSDPRITAEDARRTVTLMAGSGHGFGLTLHVFQPEEDGATCHRFSFQAHRGGRDTEGFPEDHGTMACHVARLSRRDYGAVIAGLRTPLEADLVEWWNGPGGRFGMSSHDFVVWLSGLGPAGEKPRAYCGYWGTSRIRAFLRERASLEWFRTRSKERIAFSLASPDPDARAVFSDFFRKYAPSWHEADFWWWVRERMTALAARFGNTSLLPRLALYLEPEWVEGKASRNRTACRAVNAIAAITNHDLRFDQQRQPRPLRHVAADYKAWLEKH